MPIEDVGSLSKIRRQINEVTAEGMKIDYEEAINIVKQELTVFMKNDIEEKIENNEISNSVVKNKEYLYKNKEEKRTLIKEIIYSKNIRVKGYSKTATLIDDLVEEIVGFSVLSGAFKDDEVTDIYCIKWDKIFVEKAGQNIKYERVFKSPKHYKDFVDRLCQEAGKELNNGDSKKAEFDLYQDRYEATGRAISPEDITLTIRKHSEDHITLEQLLKWEVVSKELVELTGTIINGESNIIMAGITGSGKTTTLRAFMDYFITKNGKRLLVCEDTRELFPKNEHTVELVTSKGEYGLSLRDLILIALRVKPKYIAIGEVRGAEAEAAVEGMATGHSTLFTMHSGTPIDAINRLVTKYLMQMPSLSIEVVERIIGSAVDYIYIQDDIPGIGRRVTSVTEVSYDYANRTVALKTIGEFNFETEKFEIINKISKEKATKMLRRGVPLYKIKEVSELGK